MINTPITSNCSDLVLVVQILDITTRPRKQRKSKADQLDLQEILKGPSEKMVLKPCFLGGMKIFYQDNHFEYHYAKKGVKIYRCEAFAELQCEARVLVHDGLVYSINGNHCHANVEQ